MRHYNNIARQRNIICNLHYIQIYRSYAIKILFLKLSISIYIYLWLLYNYQFAHDRVRLQTLQECSCKLITKDINMKLLDPYNVTDDVWEIIFSLIRYTKFLLQSCKEHDHFQDVPENKALSLYLIREIHFHNCLV